MIVAPMAALIASYSALAVPFFAVFQKKLRPVAIPWLLAVYCIVSFINDRLVNFFEHRNTIYSVSVITYIFSIIEYGLLTALFYRLIQNKLNRYILKAGTVLFVATAIIRLIHLHNYSLNGLTTCTSALLVINYSILYFYEWLKTDIMEPIDGKAEFWIVTGCLFYFSANFFFFINPDKQLVHTWLIISIFNFLKNVLFIAAMYKIPVRIPET
ncbi:MAG: hypothetical protein QM731_03600 [Chitinophagaceae bacterium]